ncbi:hypothetical protein MUO32_05085 [Shinella sp. CPCC 101442]|uniref:hypothetical protein n=1 Tax=Shinella sp. CPCC 101442 TaxID=2932265 RepID=UPI002152414B|nr:hypothetical protein [Shinella sp. CPCC 101442]MCR6498402.1 hypothetical protein [Shinella sp. CPCC 101442]
MKEQAEPVSAMAELPKETREFLARLRPDDLETLEDGVRLINAVKTVGTFFKWLIVGLLGFVVGAVMLYESIVKIVGWHRGI